MGSVTWSIFTRHLNSKLTSMTGGGMSTRERVVWRGTALHCQPRALVTLITYYLHLRYLFHLFYAHYEADGTRKQRRWRRGTIDPRADNNKLAVMMPWSRFPSSLSSCDFKRQIGLVPEGKVWLRNRSENLLRRCPRKANLNTEYCCTNFNVSLRPSHPEITLPLVECLTSVLFVGE